MTRTSRRPSWVSQVFGRRSRTPTRRTPPLLRIEGLEDRVVPSNYINAGGLQFFSKGGFTDTGAEHTVTKGTVDIGFIPDSGQTLTPC